MTEYLFARLTDLTEAIEALELVYQPLDSDLTAIAALSTTTAALTSLTWADPNEDRFLFWDDSADTVKPAALADLLTEASPAAGDFVLIMGAEGDVRKVNFNAFGAAGFLYNVVEDLTPQLGGDLDLNSSDITGTGNIDITGTGAFSGAVTVLDDPYDATGWNGSTEVPTKNAIRDGLIANFQPLDADLTEIAGLSPSNDDIIQQKGGVWTNRTMAQLATDLDSFFLTPAEGDAAYQPLDADLTAIAALATTAAGRSILTLADPNADRVMAWDDSVGGIVAIALADITNETAPAAGDYLLAYDSGGGLVRVNWSELTDAFQPLDGDLTSIAALTTTTAGRSVLTIADPNADRVLAWDDSAGSIAAIALADITTEANPAAGDYALMYTAAGALVKVDFSDLGGGAAAITPAAELRTASATITIPTGATKLKVKLVGGGAGGGGCNSTAQLTGCGGGAGATVTKYLSGLTPGNTLALTVNSGGGGGSAGANAGSAGGSVVLASGTETITTLTAAGGSGGAGGSTATVLVAAGGAGTNGDLNDTGGYGWGHGNLGGISMGGASSMGGGPAGVGGVSGAAGVASVVFGAGGSGGCAGTSGGSTRAGGAGKNGCAIFEWYA